MYTAIVGRWNVQEINLERGHMIRPPETIRAVSTSTCCDSVVESERVCERMGSKIEVVCHVNKPCLNKQEEAATTRPARMQARGKAQNYWTYLSKLVVELIVELNFMEFD